MAKKRLWLGMLIIVLTLGITVIGCDLDPDNDAHNLSNEITQNESTLADISDK